MSFRDIDVSHDNGVCLLTLNRPDSLNAYTPDMGEDLVRAMRAAAADDTVHALVITGAGRAFCAGADRAYLGGKASASGKQLGEEEFISSFTPEFASLPILTIAAINGDAAGIGITGMLAADIRIVAQDAKLVLNFAELGIMPAMGSSWFLPRLVGDAAARELLLCTRRIDGEQAARLGLANHAVPAPDVLPLALELAGQAADCRPGTIDAIKRGLSAGGAGSLESALELEKQLGREVRR